MLIAIIPLVVCLVGLLMFALSGNPKVTKIGDHMFWTGLLITLWVMAGHTVAIR